jgi:hypothetical protein
MLRQKLAILMALFVGFASFVWVASYSSSFQSCISQEGGQNAAKKGESQSHTIFVVSSHLRCAARFAESHNGVITAIATVLLTFVTGGLVFTGYQQIQTSRAQLRAYVVAYGKNCETTPGQFISHVEVKNTGQTPARNLKIISQTCILLHPPAADTDYSLVDPGDPSVGVLGTRQTISSASALKGNKTFQEEFDEATAENGWLRVYTYGTVFYTDVFKNSQWTNFCFYFQWESKSKVAATASQYHNDAS